MKRRGFGPLELIVLLYFLSYIANVLLTKFATSVVHPGRGRPLTGLEILPFSLLVSLVATFAFIWLSGWHRDAHRIQLGRVRVPVPTRPTALSAFGSALMLCTVPLSFTFSDISIPFMLLLMRGQALFIAPAVDFAFGRRVRWWSWAAIGTVAVALTLVVQQRGGFHLSALAVAVVVLYAMGYALRLCVMTHIAKLGDAASVRKYFVEEKVLAWPLSILVLFTLSIATSGSPSDALAWGFASMASEPVFWPMLGVGIAMMAVSVFASILLLAPNENSYCVPLERSASLLAGIAATWILHWVWGFAAPTPTEMLGAALFVGAIALLTLAPRWEQRSQLSRSPRATGSA